MKKKLELFFFFHIDNVPAFKSSLKALSPFITTTPQLLQVSTQPDTLVNVAFSFTGLTALGFNDTLGDPTFAAGQFVDAPALGDPGTANWVPAFKGTNVHGLFILASDSTLLIDAELAAIGLLFGDSLSELYTLQGQVRPGDQEGHERESPYIFTNIHTLPNHLFSIDFGFMDGISQPGITGFTANPMPGQTVIDPGHILLGETGDVTPRPPWAQDGSFLVFRQLQQLVPEFSKFLADNPIIEPGLTLEQGSALMGARMVGRWQSVSSHIILKISDILKLDNIIFRPLGCSDRPCPNV